MTPYNINLFMPGMKCAPLTLETESLGGSETAGICMARELSRLGHRVSLMCNTEKTIIDQDNVRWYPLDAWDKFGATNPSDISIVQRVWEPFARVVNSRLNWIWCHDLGQVRNRNTARATAWNIDKVLVPSKYMAKQYHDVLQVPKEQLFVTRNGIDLSVVERARQQTAGQARNMKRVVYSARPERGLDVLLKQVMPMLWERSPDYKLVICGYNNPVEHLAPFYDELTNLAASYGRRVEIRGHLTKLELYKLYLTSGLYIYPTPSPILKDFVEISCISAMEAQACGLPIVTTHNGALPETIAKMAGRLVKGSPLDKDYVAKFCNEVALLADPGAWQEASEAGLKRGRALDWSGVAKDWTKLADAEFKRLNNDPVRLARHFIRHSEIDGAKKALAKVEGRDREVEDVKAVINKRYGFARSDKTFAEHYREDGARHNSRFEKIIKERPDHFAPMFQQSGESRFQIIEQYIRNNPDAKVIADYGCGHGWCDVYLHNRVPDRSWIGVDIDPNAIKWSRFFAEKYAKVPDRLTFIEGDHTAELPEQADMLICSEVLEHVRHPQATMDSIEQWVKPGGLVVLTVPWGPREMKQVDEDTPYMHLREFDQHDIEDMFGGKPHFQCNSVFEDICPVTQMPVGFYVVTYKANRQPVGFIDWTRKLRVQRPRESVSVNILGGPGCEATLQWCLTPLRYFADEIVIADCGMSEMALRMAEAAGAKLFRASPPLQHGFETPRNEALAQSTCDWIFWVDSDERICDSERVHKYLRRNIFDAYAVRQHHFAVDTQFKPDMPARLFRRDTKKPIRFFGMIHEHPEMELNKGPGTVVILSDLHIFHVGYESEAKRRKRFARNYPLLVWDQEKYPDRKLQKHFVIRDNVQMAGYEVQKNGNRMTPNAIRLCEEAVALYKEHFAGHNMFANIDVLEYYSRALRMLGRGFECSFNFAASRDGVGPLQEPGMYRFETPDELIAELSQQIHEQADQYTENFW